MFKALIRKHTNCISEPLCLDSPLFLLNNRTRIGVFNASRLLKDSPANVVTMEMDIGKMTGVKLAEEIHNIDEKRNNLT